ncbi:MAG: hypothetical protein HDT14_00195 [Oscillibacter sp.]|nr:hypothetical protein [Oscillibacter sp.]
MKGKSCLFLTVLCLLLALTACQDTTNPSPESVDPVPEVTEPETPDPAPVEEPEEEPESERSQREQDWITDLNYLSQTYKSVHKDPFYLVSEEEFDWKIERLKAKVGQLSDEDMYFEIAALVAGMGDIHTFVNAPQSLYDRQFPIGTQHFGDKLYLTFYLEGYEQFAPYLLHEIVAVNGIDITYLEQKAASLNNPFSYWYSKENFWLNPIAFLDWAGCDYKEGYTIEFLNDNCEVESVEVPVITPAVMQSGSRVRHENWDQLLFKKYGNQAEYVYGENGGLVYLSLSSLYDASSITEPFEAAIELIKSHPDCGKLVLDLRSLPGGMDVMLVWVRAYVQDLKDLSIGKVYVAAGGYSASAAISCLASFKNDLGAVIIGEPTGQFTSFFAGTPGVYVLPNSQISVHIAHFWYEAGTIGEEYYDEDGKLYPWESTILPDVYVYQDIEDIRQGKDSVLEWVLAQ